MTNKRYECEPFTKQDMELLKAYRRVRKFQVRHRTDLKAGTYINIRQCLSLNNMMVLVVKLNGYAMMDSHHVGMRFSNAVDMNSDNGLLRPWFPGGELSGLSRKKMARKQHGGIFGGTMVSDIMSSGSNHSFHYNSKTKAFVDMLKAAPRFQQDCIFWNRAYSQENYDKFVKKLGYTKWDDEESAKMFIREPDEEEYINGNTTDADVDTTVGTTMNTDELKLSMAAQLLMSDEVHDIAGHSTACRDFMTELMFNYHKVDPKAVLGAQHMVDFLTEHHVGPREFDILMTLCKGSVYNFVLLSRGVQMGFLKNEDIMRNFTGGMYPFEFIKIGNQIKNRGVTLHTL